MLIIVFGLAILGVIYMVIFRIRLHFATKNYCDHTYEKRNVDAGAWWYRCVKCDKLTRNP